MTNVNRQTGITITMGLALLALSQSVLADIPRTWVPATPDDPAPMAFGFGNLESKPLESYDGLFMDDHDSSVNIYYCPQAAGKIIPFGDDTPGCGEVIGHYIGVNFHTSGCEAIKNKEVDLVTWLYWQRVDNAPAVAVNGPAPGGESVSASVSTGMSVADTSTFTESIGAEVGGEYEGLSAKVNATMSWTQSQAITISEGKTVSKTFLTKPVAEDQIRVDTDWQLMRGFALVKKGYQPDLNENILSPDSFPSWNCKVNICRPNIFDRQWECTSPETIAQDVKYFRGPFLTPAEPEVQVREISTCFDLDAWDNGNGQAKIVDCKKP